MSVMSLQGLWSFGEDTIVIQARPIGHERPLLRTEDDALCNVIEQGELKIPAR